ncbi:hypothetical protein, conserved [Eimeria maxima]|uniref:Uncharacterized protein n=1 Tax=Eimeria maxima TaxID=5804 RepID=U6LXI4_EIMMA|nr:hypothetical protein, conserved [Eimeria maxima]CDJ56657.1 hypothetical protein, conserved [Eimeria maxima]
MTLPQQPAGSEVVETSPSAPKSQIQGTQNNSAALSWAARASKAPAAAPPPKSTGPRMGAPKGPPTEPAVNDTGKGKVAVQSPSASAAPKKPVPLALPAFARASRELPVVVVDAGALMRVEALDRYRGKCTFITTTQAAQEVRDAVARQRIESRMLEVHTLEPSAADRGWAEKFADMTGDLPFLSQTDLDLIALTYMLQRATGETEHLKARPPAFEFFSEVELMQKLENDGAGKQVWTLQHNSWNSKSSSSVPRNSTDTNKDSTEDAEREEEGESAHTEDEEDDMDAEEGWVTEEVLREHLGLAASSDNCNHEASAKENESNEPNESQETNCQEVDNSLSKAFGGLELRADMQEIEDLVACMTADFSMQNVLLQMGLKVLTVDGRKIRTVKIWALLCRACGHIERKTRLLFCSKCGHYTLDRTPLYFDQNTGKIFIFDGRKKISKRGQVYSIPKDKGGKHSRPIILAADQLMMGGLDRELRHKENLWRKDVESKNPFSPNYCLEAQSWHVRIPSFDGSAPCVLKAPHRWSAAVEATYHGKM